MVYKKAKKLKLINVEVYRKFNWKILPGLVLFFMMLFVPTRYQPIKAALLMLVLTIIGIKASVRSRFNLHPVVLLWTFIMVMFGLFFILRGLLNEAPGAVRVATVYVLWPIVYVVLVAGVSNVRMIYKLIRVLVFATISIGVYSLSYILYVSGWLPGILYIPIDQGQSISFYSGFIAYNLYNISSLLFLVPFLIAALLTWSKQRIMPVSRSWLWIALVFGLTLVLLSGRKALLLVVALSPVITLFFKSLLQKQNSHINRKTIITVFISLGFVLFAIIIYLHSIYNFSLQSVITMFVEGFDFQHSGSAIVRRKQFFSLLEGWKQHPLFGAGLGAGAEYHRSSKQPWAYELSYMALFYQTGLIGFFIYASEILWIFWMGIRVIRNNQFLSIQILPILVGTMCFLIGNATNPYLGKYDYIWVIFLPIAYINIWLLKTKRNKY